MNVPESAALARPVWAIGKTDILQKAATRRLYTELRRAYRAAKREPLSLACSRAQTAALAALRTLTNDWEPEVFGSIDPQYIYTTCYGITLFGRPYYRPKVSNTTIRTLRRWNTLPLPSP